MPPHENTPSPKPKTVHFVLDGRALTTDDSTLTAGQILQLGGLDPAGYDLIEGRKGGTPQHYRDDQQVAVHNGDVFRSLRQSAPVA